jgi:hypothetical protein
MVSRRLIGRRLSSITCYAAPNPMQGSGITYARTQCVRDLLRIGKIGRSAAKSFGWNIALSEASAVIDRRYSYSFAALV